MTVVVSMSWSFVQRTEPIWGRRGGVNTTNDRLPNVWLCGNLPLNVIKKLLHIPE